MAVTGPKTGFSFLNGDLGDRYVSIDYLLDVYPSLLPANKTPGLWAFGFNGPNGPYGGGELGLGDTNNRSSPVQVGTLTNWKQVAGASAASAAIKTDGTLWTWGDGSNGLLGLGAVTHRSSPVQVGTLTNWKQVSYSVRTNAGAVKTDGTLWMWGMNYYGALGLGNTTPRSSPVQVGSLTNWKQFSACGWHSGAVKTDGTLWMWGGNNYYLGGGMLGLGDITHRSSPVQVGTLTNWKQVSGNIISTVAVKTDGTLWTWGANPYGNLGLNDTTHRSSPTQVGSLTDWKQVASGAWYHAAIKNDGTLWMWGRNQYGVLGLGGGINRSSPTQVGSLTNWKYICDDKWMGVHAIKTDGTLWGWGRNAYGQLGLGDTSDRGSPVQIGTLNTWKTVSGGSDWTLAIKDGYV